MATERIDVLAVMDDVADEAGAAGLPWHEVQLREARAAVAELIEAASVGVVSNNQTFDVVTSQRIACGELSAPPLHMTLTFNGKSAERMIAALARVGGAR